MADPTPAGPASQALFDRGRSVIPGGVSSPVRAFGSVGGTPRFIARAAGPLVWDADGREYVDLVCSWGPALLGHAHPLVVDAVREAAGRGLSFGAPTSGEVELAEEVVRRVGPVERLRLVSTGTEATMTAARLARGATGRPLIVKFAGCYHGHVDSMLVSAGSGLATLGIPSSPGVPTAVAAGTVVCAFNDVDGTALAVADHAESLAAIVVEPVAGNMGVVPPAPGFLEALRELCDATGALLVFDEVITGFRVGRGGAQGRYGVLPDLTILGKIVGGGLPLAAFGGSAELMERLAPVGDVYQAGTLSGNPLATAAGLSVLRRLRDPRVYERLERSGARLEAGLAEFGRVQRVGAMATLFAREGAVTCFEDAAASDTELYGALFRHLLGSGVYVAPSQFECLFVSTAHGDDEVDATVEAVRDFFEAA
jgi:glutamate-1-semialdehyde 2,1-aminomutase